MKTIKTISALFMGLALATSCQDSFHEYDGAASDQSAAYEQVAFSKDSDNVEIEPNGARIYSVDVTRNTKKGEIDVPVTVLTNDSNVFQIPEKVHFNDGDSVAQLSLYFPSAEKEVSYSACVQLGTTTGAVSDWTANTHFKLTACVVQWNYIGKGTFEENYWWGDASTVDIYQRDGDHDIFRIVGPFDNMSTASTKYMDGNQTQKAQIEILHKKDVKAGVEISTEGLVYFATMNTGYYYSDYGQDVKMYHPADLYSSPEESYFTGSYLAASRDTTYAGDTIKSAFPQKVVLSPYYYIDGAGGWNRLTKEDVSILFPGYHDPYEADITSDFVYEDTVFEDYQLTSKAGTSVASLLKGECVNDLDDCDKTFAETYGTAYCIPSMYTEDYDIFFAVNKEGEFTLPAGCEYQNTGLVSLGEKIYIKINTDKCELTDNSLTLNVTFQNEDGSIVYGSSDEVLNFITYSAVATGDFTFKAFFGNAWDDETGECTDPWIQTGLTIMKQDGSESAYKVVNWCDYKEEGTGVDFSFTWDKSTNKCVVPAQLTPYESSTYGPLYVADLAQLFGNDAYYKYYPCEFDATTSTFTFTLAYYYLGYEDYCYYDTEYMTYNTTSSVKGAHKTPRKASTIAKAPNRKAKRLNGAKHVFVGHASGKLVKPAIRK